MSSKFRQIYGIFVECLLFFFFQGFRTERMEIVITEKEKVKKDDGLKSMSIYFFEFNCVSAVVLQLQRGKEIYGTGLYRHFKWIHSINFKNHKNLKESQNPWEKHCWWQIFAFRVIQTELKKDRIWMNFECSEWVECKEQKTIRDAVVLFIILKDIYIPALDCFYRNFSLKIK